MKLLGEEGEPWDENSPHADGLDRDLVVAAHEAFRAEWMRQMSTNLFSATTSLGVEFPTASAPLSSLNVITLPQLIVGKRHKGKVLHGRLSVKPFKMSGIVSVLQDVYGRAARLTIYNVLPGTASAKAVEDRFPIGIRVTVKEPFFELCTDGKTAIRVDNPADIALNESWQEQMDSSPSPQCTCDNELAEDLEVIRCEGNELFSTQNWIGAVSKYSICINRAFSETATHKRNKSSPSKLNKVLRLAYSNRAEAKLRLETFEDALNDADKALEFDPKDVKSLVRKGRAAHRLGLYEKSITSFNAALDQAPQEESILSMLKASTIAYEQSRTGNYDLSDFFLRDCTGDVPPCADFIGPVEIRRVYNGGYGGRGLFATKRVKLGELLLVSNALAILRSEWEFRKPNVDFKVQKRTGVVTSGIQDELIVELAKRIIKSKREMAQLYSLASYGKHEMEIPSMDLFRPGSEWIPPGAEKLELDICRVGDIAHMNAFRFASSNIFEIAPFNGNGTTHPRDGLSGLWVLPSFANHSCAPNCMPAFVGDAMFVRAAKDVAEGEELTIPYLSEALSEVLRNRRDVSKIWFFECKCERCLMEESLKPQLAKVTKAITKVHEAPDFGVRRPVEELADIADLVDAVIQSPDTKLTQEQQSWLRAAFSPMYFANYEMAMHDCGSPDFPDKLCGTLQLFVNSLASVCVDATVLNWAAALLQILEERYSNQSFHYQFTRIRVLDFYKVAFGKQPYSVMDKLIRARYAPT